jgi:sec-independent protein translocase protein TatA
MGIGGSEWVIIGLITIFLLFGSRKLPDMTRHLGKAIGEYNNTKRTLLDEVNKVKFNNNSFDPPSPGFPHPTSSVEEAEAWRYQPRCA